MPKSSELRMANVSLPEDILTARVGAEEILPGGRDVRGHHVGLVRRIWRKERAKPP